ncbi:serpin family protein [Planctomicrobium piriforme]|uniref:Serine protease inhibitor n=1 Tax=Planctomicrobium piriforme TaxID=1576369 RepID=A0A1I3DYE6_9PLAN|nr:serpin family protein [Planctomicrobium piriforme]SFH91746.1 Serine protease inhibitor [Planctomicrobium piriforme]
MHRTEVGAAILLLTIAAVAFGDSCLAQDSVPTGAKIEREVVYFAPQSKSTSSSGTFLPGTAVQILRLWQREEAWWVLVESTDGRKGWVEINAFLKKDDHTGAPANTAHQVASRLRVPSNPQRMNNLGIWFLRNAQNGSDNAIVSPCGIWSNLRVLEQAAGPSSNSTVARLIGPNLSSNLPVDLPEVESSDMLFVRKGLSLTEEFQRVLKASGVSWSEASFDNDDRIKINQKIYELSHQLIRDFFSPETWSADAEVVIANVVWLRQAWAIPFDPQATHTANFNVSKQETIPVSMMIKTDQLDAFASESLNCDGVILPYAVPEIVAIVIVPREIDGLVRLLEKIDNNSLDATIGSARSSRTTVQLPRFDAEAELDVLEALKKIGFPLGEIELTGMFNGPKVRPSLIAQKSRLSVNETVTEAVAVTGSTYSPSSVNVEPIKLISADRPFLFVVQHVKTRALLFVATVSTPTRAK